jgi:hypothetical protein
MKKIFALCLLLLMALSSICYADTYVNGYYRNDGTYVQGYHRSDANGTTSDNYSHQGNTNPYTGKKGNRN